VLAVAIFAANVGAAGAGVGAALAAVAALGVAAVLRAEAGLPRAAAPVGRSAPPPLWRRLAQGGVALAAAGALAAAVVEPFQAAVACRDGDRRLGDDPDEALACYERAVALDAADVRAWLKLSGAAQASARRAPTAAARGDRFARALAALDRAAALAPPDPYVPANRGRLLGEMACDHLAHPDESAAAWDAALAADPANAAFLAEAARSALAVGRLDRMRLLVERGQALYPNFALWRFHLGAAAYAEGRLPEAADALAVAVAGEWYGDADGAAHASAMLATIHIGQTHYAEALNLAAHAHELAPDWPTPWLLRARALEHLQRHAEAQAAYRRVLALAPDNAEARAACRRLGGAD
jgi:tetratricopeptide (TPR) repeat protein